MTTRRSRSEHEARVDPQAVLECIDSALGKLDEAAAYLENAVDLEKAAVKQEEAVKIDGWAKKGRSELKVLREQVLDVSLQATVIKARLDGETKTANDSARS